MLIVVHALERPETVGQNVHPLSVCHQQWRLFSFTCFAFMQTNCSFLVPFCFWEKITNFVFQVEFYMRNQCNIIEWRRWLLYIFICVRLCVYVFMCVRVCAFVCVVCTYMFVCMCAHACVCVYMCVCLCVCVSVCVFWSCCDIDPRHFMSCKTVILSSKLRIAKPIKIILCKMV